MHPTSILSTAYIRKSYDVNVTGVPSCDCGFFPPVTGDLILLLILLLTMRDTLRSACPAILVGNFSSASCVRR